MNDDQEAWIKVSVTSRGDKWLVKVDGSDRPQLVLSASKSERWEGAMREGLDWAKIYVNSMLIVDKESSC